jgi:salicylate hydroxylase
MIPELYHPAQTYRGSPNLPIAIIGGGLTGLACSIDLTRRGLTHTIYESAKYYQQDGAGVVLDPAAMAALGQIDPGLRERLNSCALRNWDKDKSEWSKESKSWLTFRHGMATVPMSTVDAVGNKTPGFGSVIADTQACGPTEVGRRGVLRETLVEKMIGLIPTGTTKFGKHLVGLEDYGIAVKLTFRDETWAWASAVLACDGIGSVVRRTVLWSDPASIEPAFAGEYCYRTLIPMEHAQSILGDERARTGNIFSGYQGYVAIYPVLWQQHEFVNMTAVRRHRDNTWPDVETWRQPCTMESVLEDFKGWGSDIMGLLKTINKPEKFALFDSQPAKTYTKGLLCLLGDAAHASTPHQGDGAPMAFEDACIVGHLLQKARDPRGIKRAFHVFNKVRRARTQHLVFTSRAAGQFFEFANGGIMNNIDKIRKDLKIRHNFDIRLQLRQADREYNALFAAQTLLPYVGGDQWIELTTSQEGKDYDDKSVDIDSEEDWQHVRMQVSSLGTSPRLTDISGNRASPTGAGRASGSIGRCQRGAQQGEHHEYKDLLL